LDEISVVGQGLTLVVVR